MSSAARLEVPAGGRLEVPTGGSDGRAIEGAGEDVDMAERRSGSSGKADDSSDEDESDADDDEYMDDE